LKLQTAAGASVETMPAVTKVDFAQLVDLTEVISAGQIPAAEYVSATLTLDYTGANITADDGTGAAVALKPVDAKGAALTGPVAVSITLDNANHLLITPGRTGRLAFDFNLAASNTVDLMAATVTVSPTLVASVVPSDGVRWGRWSCGTRRAARGYDGGGVWYAGEGHSDVHGRCCVGRHQSRESLQGPCLGNGHRTHG
jgi:hypothetical protein